jgi:hypothetical protein
MAETARVNALIDSIKEAAGIPGGNLRAAIEERVERVLSDLPLQEKMLLLEEAARHFGAPKTGGDVPPAFSPGESARLVALLLGKDKLSPDLSPEDISQRLVNSLNTVFDSLNKTIRIINSTLLGQTGELETIRAIIGSEIGGASVEIPLQEYLDQIQEAFLVAHKAFRAASENVVGRILSEFDPEKMTALAEGKLKFGPMKKAELFDIFTEKFESCKRSLESGHLMEEFLREFEKTCQKLYKTDARREP